MVKLANYLLLIIPIVFILSTYSSLTQENRKSTVYWNKVLERAVKVIQEDQNNTSAIVAKWLALKNLDRENEANQVYIKAIEYSKDNPEFLTKLGISFYKVKDSATPQQDIEAFGKAIETFEKVLELEPKNEKNIKRLHLVWRDKALTLISSEDYEEASEAFDKAIELDPNDSISWEMKGRVLLELNNYEDSVSAFDAAIDTYTDLDVLKLERIFYHKGIAYSYQNKYEDAIDAYDEAIRIKPDFYEAQNNKSSSLILLGRYDEANLLLDKSIELNPENFLAYLNKGVASLALKNYPEAVEAYEGAINIVDNKKCNHSEYKCITPYVELSETLLLIGAIDDANEIVKKGLSLNENNPKLNLTKGKIHLHETINKKLDYEGALKSFEKAVKYDLGNPTPLIWLGYAKYLYADYNSKSKDNHNNINLDLLQVIKTLEKAHYILGQNEEYKIGWGIPKIQDKINDDLRAINLYLLGFIHYKNEDYITAIEQLQESAKLESSVKRDAEILINDIWDNKLYPQPWEWWMNSPLSPWPKRIVFITILALIIGLLSIHPYLSKKLDSNNIHWPLYVMLVVFLILVLLFPFVKNFKTGDFEFEFKSRPNIEPVLSSEVGYIPPYVKDSSSVIEIKNTNDKNNMILRKNME